MDMREALSRALPYPASAKIDTFIADLADDGFCIMPIERHPLTFPNHAVVIRREAIFGEVSN